MTTVVALAHDGYVYMGADRCTNVYDRPVVGVSKIVIRDPKHGCPFALGFAGEGALPSLVALHLVADETPTRAAEDDAMNNWANAIARAITEIAIENHCTDGGRMDSHILIGCNGRLWTATHMQAVPHADGRAAIGSGEGPAIGALDAGMHFNGYSGDMPSLIALAVRIGVSRDRYSDGEPQVVMV